MKKTTIVAGTCVALLVLLALAVGRGLLEREILSEPATSSTFTQSTGTVPTHPASEESQGFLYGRITTQDGTAYEGRLRWGDSEEAFWGNYFNGFKDENPWSDHIAPEQLTERRPLKIFGVEVTERAHPINLERPFMARFGDIVRIEALDADVRVTLKSGTVFDLDRNSADDLADGLRVWDDKHGAVDFHERQIRTIEFLPSAATGALPYRLHGTVSTRQGDFAGFLQWDRAKCVGHDELVGHTAEGPLSLRFELIDSIARNSDEGSLVTLLDGREIALSGTREVGEGNRGIYVDDRRYGRVLISWDAFMRADFNSGGSGPAYGDFPTGRPLAGSVTTHAGRVITGRLVYDLDESETSETLDAPFQGVDYTIPFGLIAAIVPAGGEARALVSLHNGEELELEPAGDLGKGNGGMLVFIDGGERAEYVHWSDVQQISFDNPPAMHPPIGER